MAAVATTAPVPAGAAAPPEAAEAKAAGMRRSGTKELPHDRPRPVLPSHLTAINMLGKGAYGEVFLCESSRDGNQYAVKWIRNFARSEDPVFGKRILREIRLMARMRHENVLNLVDVMLGPNSDSDDVYIQMPFMDIDLNRLIYSKRELHDKHHQAIACQILRGLEYLHAIDVVHRDLKPANILVDKACQLRIADLGLARGRNKSDDQLTDYVVTRWYRAPELMLFPAGYWESIDIWSVGCIYVEMLTKKPLFMGSHHSGMIKLIAAALGFHEDRDLQWLPEGEERDQIVVVMQTLNLPREATDPLEARLPGVSEDALDLLRKFFIIDPRRRISARDALFHPYLVALREKNVGEHRGPVEHFCWDFDTFEPTPQAIRERIFEECAKFHPELLSKGRERRGSLCTSPPSRLPVGPAPARAPIGAPGRGGAVAPCSPTAAAEAAEPTKAAVMGPAPTRTPRARAVGAKRLHAI